MLNHIVIMGRLARDPELRHTQAGIPVASFTLAVDRDFKDKTTGERATDWIDVVAWRSTGEFVSRYFAKGRMAVVDGRLQAGRRQQRLQRRELFLRRRLWRRLFLRRQLQQACSLWLRRFLGLRRPLRRR